VGRPGLARGGARGARAVSDGRRPSPCSRGRDPRRHPARRPGRRSPGQRPHGQPARAGRWSGRRRGEPGHERDDGAGRGATCPDRRPRGPGPLAERGREDSDQDRRRSGGGEELQAAVATADALVADGLRPVAVANAQREEAKRCATNLRRMAGKLERSDARRGRDRTAPRRKRRGRGTASGEGDRQDPRRRTAKGARCRAGGPHPGRHRRDRSRDPREGCARDPAHQVAHRTHH
jgi:hypothetical protein